MFVGREKELSALNKHYAENKFSFIPIYGRRRIGKTQLIDEFINGKKAVFFTAIKGTYNENLTLLSNAIFDSGDAPVFSDFDKALNKIYEMAKEEKIIFVIDEYPYFAESQESVSSVLQRTIDHKFLKTNMLLILSGSSMSFMENQVLGYQSPLYGRRNGQIKLLPLKFSEAVKFAPRFSKTQQAVMFGATGGIPKYLSLFSDEIGLDENLKNLFFDRNNFLFEETDNLLKQELNEPSFYKAIITAIAGGASQMKDIVSKTQSESGVCSTYMKSLLELGIVVREVPITEKADSRKSLYRLNDGMFRFWYRFVYPNISLINLDKGEMVYQRIKEQIPNFMGEVFEKICIEYMWHKYDELPVAFQDIGRWWGNNPLLKKQQEIDFIATAADKSKAIFGECKWTNEKVSEGVIDVLIEKSRMFGFNEKHYYIFSKSGFTPNALKREGEHIKLIEFESMFE